MHILIHNNYLNMLLYVFVYRCQNQTVCQIIMSNVIRPSKEASKIAQSRIKSCCVDRKLRTPFIILSYVNIKKVTILKMFKINIFYNLLCINNYYFLFIYFLICIDIFI